MNKLRVYILFFAIALSFNKVYSYFDVTLPVHGDTIANNTLQYQIVNDLFAISTKTHSACTLHKISNTQIVHFPYDVVIKKNKMVKGYWKEMWTVDSCGNKKQFPVNFTIKKNKVIYNIDKSFLY